jgi:hypothetical protein
MRKLLLLALSLLATSCLYTRVTTPLDNDLDATVLGDKVGRASYQSVLWTASWGDAGTQAAAEDGGISVIHHADHEIYSIFFGFIYFRETTILYGE